MRVASLLCLLALLPSCQRPASALQTCGKLEAAGLVANCKASQRGGLTSWAKDRADFSVVGSTTGQILSFEGAADFDKTVAGFDAAAVLAGPHRYGAKDRLLFVQLNDRVPDEIAAKIRDAALK